MSSPTTGYILTWDGAKGVYAFNPSGFTYASGITAYTPGGQGSATILTKNKNRVDTVPTTNSSCILLQAVAGLSQFVHNNATLNDMYLYPFLGDAFLGQAIDAPIVIVAGQKADCFCYNDGTWTLN